MAVRLPCKMYEAEGLYVIILIPEIYSFKVLIPLSTVTETDPFFQENHQTFAT
jgi:hypothetical protein